MTHIDDIKSKEELASDMQVEIQALGINLESSLNVVKLLLLGIFILGIVALVHFW
jgi:hypothetical protein